MNGAAFPYLKVEPRRYRFHLLNGSNHRDYILSFGNAPVYQIGADDNYFDKPVPLSSVTISPGERADIIVDFSNSAGQNITVGNSGVDQDPTLPLREIMQFRVASRLKTPETSCDPTRPAPSIGVCARKDPFVRLTDGKGHVLPGVKIDNTRQMLFYDYIINGTPPSIKEFVNNTDWNGLESPGIAHDFPKDGISELPRVGSIEKWQILFLSTMPGEHPFHIHLAQFQVLKRQSLNTNAKAYLKEWNEAFGTIHPELLLPGC